MAIAASTWLSERFASLKFEMTITPMTRATARGNKVVARDHRPLPCTRRGC